MKNDASHRVPNTTTTLLLSANSDVAWAHAASRLPQDTHTVTTKAQYTLDVVPFPPAATPPPILPVNLRRRQAPNMICGYIGGDPQLPATCSAGSYCVLDTAHGVIGCCPDGETACTTGIFTGCVDSNSPPPTDADPYVYTCQAGQVCYRNEFNGGYFQFGCGTASSLAATVLASASGITSALSLPSITVTFDQPPGSLPRTMTAGPSTSVAGTSGSAARTQASSVSTSSRLSRTPSTVTSTPRGSSTANSVNTTPASARTSTTTTSRSSSSTASTITITQSPTATQTDVPPTMGRGQSPNHIAAIIGGTIGAAVALTALILGCVYLWRRRQRARLERTAGVDPAAKPAYTSPSTGGGGGGAANTPESQPLHQSPEEWSTQMAPAMAMTHPQQPAWWSSRGWVPAGDGAHDMSSWAASAGGSRAARNPTDDDQVPLTREIDEFSTRFRDALGRIDYNGYMGSGPIGMARTTGQGNQDERPLWQQDRRLSRNMMWM